ncbi:MAG: hypothetical protein IT422_01410 [Pirellulaceae bacterium]|jgi:type II secretory pathway pseudopilin PulG|nr:hypothetical protein [Pirellulaceae bacterium]
MRSHSPLKAKAATPARKQAFTLIEMLVALSFGSSIMLTAVALVHSVFQLQSQAQTRLEQTSILDRYVEQFRRDVSLAVRFELPTEKTLRLFFVGERRVEYQTDENHITRRAFDGDVLQQVEPAQLEAGRVAQFAQVHSGRCLVLDILILESEGKPSTAPPSAVRQIVVAVGTINGAGGNDET